ncbi:MAG TPA: YaiI/YqxD family protein [Steroidobacteraceae bacterium]|nr:YaiI/YqxD family protein [Steroidobacteraceae bacterium]
MPAEPHIYVDADACPVKAETARVAERHALAVTFVANAWLQPPRAPRMRVQVVAGAYDAADDWIVANARAGDVVITTDIPLASRCLQKDALVLTPVGKRFTGDNIGNALATRELLSDLRAYGVGGGPPPFAPRDRSRFLDALELAVREAKLRSALPSSTLERTRT